MQYMQSPEFAIMLLNSAILLVAYLSVYPKLAGYNLNKVAWLDMAASCLALIIVGYKYWGTGQGFSLILVEANWFWFTLASYMVLEIPISLWYFRKLLFNKHN